MGVMLRVALIVGCIAAALCACEPHEVRAMEHALSRFTYPLFDVRQHEAHNTPADVVSHIRRIVRTPVEQLDQNFLLLCKAAGVNLQDCKTCKYFFEDSFREELIQSTQYLFQLQRLKPLQPVPDKRVVVVGSGPAGLIAGVHSTIFGLNTTIVDGRGSRTRNIWFDLATEAENAPSRELIAELGGRFTNMRIQEHAGTNMISVRCQELERFLAKTLLFLGGEIVAKSTVVAVLGGNSSSSWSVETHLGSHTKHIGFDLLVLAEGHDGQIMRKLGIPSVSQQVLEIPSPFDWLQPEAQWRTKSSFFEDRIQDIENVQAWLQNPASLPQRHFDRELFFVEALHQTTLIAKFSPLPNGECPPLRKNGTEVLDPFVPGAVIEGVTSVFKRFFYSYCELQVLLDHEAGLRIHEEFASIHGSDIRQLPTDSQLWTKLIQTWQLLLGDGAEEVQQADLVNPTTTRAWLSSQLSGDRLELARNTILRQLRTTTHGALDVRVLQLKVEMAPTTTGMLMPKRPPYSPVPFDLESSRRSGKRPAVIVLGDASVTSHYRLGVGVNHAVRTAHDLRNVFHAMRSQGVAVDAQGELVPASPRAFFNALVDFHAKALYRNYALVQYQLFAMYFEAYCRAVAYGNQLFRVVPGSFEFSEVSIADLRCVQPMQPIFVQ